MKIALVRASYNPFGGAERFLNDAVAAMAGREVQFTLLTRAWPDQGATKLPHRVLNPRHFTSLGRDRGFADAVVEHIGRTPYDLVQSYERIPGIDIYHGVDGVHAEWLAQRQRISGRIKSFGVAINPRHRFILKAERAMYASPQFQAAICISRMVKNDIIRHFDTDPARLHVIYSGVDSEKFSPAGRAPWRAPTRARLHIPANASAALFVGSGFERKGLESFLRALAVPSAKKIFGIVVGKDKALARYRGLAGQLGLADRIVFTGGVSDTRPYYAAADVFVLPTLYEPFGLVCLEAMAAGLPVVTSTACGAAELITEGVEGLVTDALDVEAISGAIHRAIAKPAMGDAARKRAERFTPQAMAGEYAALYQRLKKRPS